MFWEGSLLSHASSSIYVYPANGLLRVAACCLFSCTVTDFSGKLIYYYTKTLMISTAFLSLRQENKGQNFKYFLQIENSSRCSWASQNNSFLNSHSIVDITIQQKHISKQTFQLRKTKLFVWKWQKVMFPQFLNF